MSARCRPLVEVLAAVPDPRSRQGRRHPLPAVLTLACVAMLCGYQSYGAIAEWARNYGRPWAQALGVTPAIPPCAATLHAIFRALDRSALEACLAAWAEEVLQALPPAPDTLEAIALDGKTLRGSRRQGAPGTHLLSAVSQRLGLTLQQEAVDAKTNEIPVAAVVLAGLVLTGRVFTMDALLTQRALAQQIVDGGRDYVMVIKPNQPDLWAAVDLRFRAPPSSLPPPAK